MEREQFEIALQSVEPGHFASVTYAAFEELFPPGVLDEGAKGAAYDFARAHGFHIENRPDKLAVWFWKDEPRYSPEATK